MPGTPTSTAVAAFYDNTDVVDALLGSRLHMGYWPGSTNLEQAQDHLTDLVIAALDAPRGCHVLDVGCGTGGPARRLARTSGVAVTGVTLSARQAEQAGAAPGVSFRVADVVRLPFPERTFDAAMVLESLFHVADKRQALREIARVLRPGARLAVADLTQRRPLEAPTPGAAQLLGLLACEEAGAYEGLLADAGFTIHEARGIGTEISATYRALLDRMAGNRPVLEKTIGEETVLALEEAVQALAAAAEGGDLGYVLLTASLTERAEV
ncbi:SAM-dependent methyltransferase [Kitasatospora sp. NPDC101183]|uniref:SAM-dependent methyltransferase n=1 Tax=Kitasatospora sp. NPDC101183 TaxID=3364100 RepID=UPI00382BBEE3